MGVDGTRRCQRGGSFQRSARGLGLAVIVGAGAGMAWGGAGVPGALGCGVGDGAGSEVALTSEGPREQAAAAGRTRRATEPTKKSVRIRGEAYSTSAMRDLSPAPDSILDPATRLPRLGSYRGGLPRVDWKPLGIGRAARVLQHKRWLYVAITSGDLYVALAIVRLGYASSAFVYAYEAATGRMLVQRSWVAPPFAALVSDTGGAGCHARFSARGVHIVVERARREPYYGVHVETRGLSLSASLDAGNAPPAIGAVAEVAPGRFCATEKRALLAVRGSLRVHDPGGGDVTASLDGALAGYDFTSGLLARHTEWRWAFALGRLEGGEPFALNLVEGFVGEAECAAWVGGEVVGLGEGRFTFDRERPMEPWRVRTADGVADLTMTPGAVHEEKRDVVVARSHFVQPCGAWTGRIALPGRAPWRVERALGVTEIQDATW
jgi:hypothetical protein